MSSSKPIVLFGGFGGANVGDEAIAYSVCREFADRNQEVTHLICHRPPTPEAVDLYDHLGVDSLGKWDWKPLRKILRDHRLVIGGGQLLNGTRVPRGLGYVAGLIELNRRCGHQPEIIGIGATNLQNGMSKWFTNRIVGGCKRVAIRDRSSFDLLRQVKEDPKLVLTADVVLGGKLRGLCDTNSTERDTIVFAIRFDPSKQLLSIEAQIQFLSKLAERFPDHRIVAAAHDIRPQFDQKAIDAVQAASQLKGKVECISLTRLPDAAHLYQRAVIAISSRMHPLIMSVVLGGKAVAIKGSSKVDDFCNELSIPSIDSPEQNNQSGSFETSLSIIESLIQNNVEQAVPIPDSISRRVADNFQWDSDGAVGPSEHNLLEATS